MRSEEAKKQMSIMELGDQSGGIKEAGDICRVQVMQAHVMRYICLLWPV